MVNDQWPVARRSMVLMMGGWWTAGVCDSKREEGVKREDVKTKKKKVRRSNEFLFLIF